MKDPAGDSGIFFVMINIDDLWVGDKLSHRKTGEKGTFDGVLSGQVKFKTANGIKLVSPQDLDLYVEEEKEEALTFEDEAEASSKYDLWNFPKSLDLHIERLSPSHLNAQPERILSLQLEALENYLDAAEQSHIKIVTIIHDKGTGVLKAETHHRLKARSSVKFFVEASQGGAVEVWMV